MCADTKIYEGVAQKKSYAFALAILKVCTEIQQKRKEYILSKQLIRSGTSIGANLHEALGRQSSKDLLTKLHISYKEAYESKYWIRLMTDMQLISSSKSKELLAKNEELLKIIGTSVKTLRKRLNY